MEHLFFHGTQAFHLCHEPVNRLSEVFKQVKVSELIMSDQVEQPCITLKIGAQIDLPVDDLVKILNRFVIFSRTKIKTGNFIIEYKNAVPVDVQFKFL